MKTNRKPGLIPLGNLLAALALLCACSSDPTQTAGNTSRSSNAFQISGRATYPGSAPAAGAAVYIRPKKFYAVAGSSPGAEAKTVATGTDGSFRLDNIAPGDYALEIRDSVSHAALIITRVQDQDVAIPGSSSILRPTGAIRGVLACPSGCPRLDSAYISVRGLWNSVWAAPDGNFIVQDVPEGVYTVRFDIPWASAQTIIGLVEQSGIIVVAAETTQLDTIRFPDRTAVYSDSLYARDSLTVRSILDINGITGPVAGYTGVLRNRIISLVDTRGDIKILPAAIGQLDQLEILILHGGKIRTFPTELGNLTALLRLDLVDQDLTALPPGIGNMPQLVELTVIGNQLDTLPACLYARGSLLFLNLKMNGLAFISDDIKDLGLLRKLDLSDNRLAGLPAGLRSLAHLEILDVSYNKLCALSADWVQWLNTINAGWDSTQTCAP
jgi:hypothetical protein